MNVERNPKTFNYLFNSFVRMGEEKLGRHLTADEINQLKPSIAKKCETIDKKYIVREIYNLEKSRKEQEKGHLGIREKLNLRKRISTFTNSKVKYTSSSKDLAKVVANNFTNIHVRDAFKRNPNLKLKPPEVLKEEKRKLRDSYIKDNFHYKAPLSLSDKLKRWVALGLVGASAIGIIGHEILFKDQNINTQEETTITDVSEPEILTPKSYIEKQLKNTSALDHFKQVFIDEYNSINDSNFSSNIEVRSVKHTYILQATDTNGNTFYLTKGNSPGTTEELLEKAGYICKRISDEDYTEVISVTTNDRNDLLAACAKVAGEYVPIICDGIELTDHAPSNEELNSGYSNIFTSKRAKTVDRFVSLCEANCFKSIIYSNDYDYTDSILEFINKNPDSVTTQKINSAIKESKKDQSQIFNTPIEIEDDGRY